MDGKRTVLVAGIDGIDLAYASVNLLIVNVSPTEEVKIPVKTAIVTEALYRLGYEGASNRVSGVQVYELARDLEGCADDAVQFPVLPDEAGTHAVSLHEIYEWLGTFLKYENESHVQTAVVNMLRREGMSVHCFNLSAMAKSGLPGWFDLVAFYHDTVLLIETKAPGKKPRESQLRVAESIAPHVGAHVRPMLVDDVIRFRLYLDRFIVVPCLTYTPASYKDLYIIP